MVLRLIWEELGEVEGVEAAAIAREDDVSDTLGEGVSSAIGGICVTGGGGLVSREVGEGESCVTEKVSLSSGVESTGSGLQVSGMHLLCSIN